MKLELVDTDGAVRATFICEDDGTVQAADVHARNLMEGRPARGVAPLAVVDGNGDRLSPADGPSYLGGLQRMFSRSSSLQPRLTREEITEGDVDLQEAEFKGRAIRRVTEVRKLTAGDLVRFSDGHHARAAATLIGHRRTGKRIHKALVHVHSTNRLELVPHSAITHARVTRTKGERLRYLKLARFVAHGRRAATQSLGPHDPIRLNAASHARHADEALRGLGAEIPHIHPQQLAERELGGPRERLHQPELPARVGLDAERLEWHEPQRAPHPPFEPGSVRHLEPPDPMAHPKHLRPGDEVLYHEPLPGRRIIGNVAHYAPGSHVPGERGSGAVGTGRHAIVIEHNRKAGILHAYDTRERKRVVIPYSRVHHVRHNFRSDREQIVRDQVGGKHRKPLLDAVRGDRSIHRRLTDETGWPAWFRSPTFIRGGRMTHGGTAWPSAPGDVLGKDVVGPDGRKAPIHAMGGVTPYWDMTDREGEFRGKTVQECALMEANAKHTGAMVALYPPKPLAQRLAVAGGEDPEALHVTLVFLGSADQLKDPDQVRRIVSDLAESTPPLSGAMAGHGVFTHGDDAPITIAHVDLPALSGVRHTLARRLAHTGHAPSSLHGFTPHMTLAYGRAHVHVPAEPVTFDRLSLVRGGQREDFPLTGHLREAEADVDELQELRHEPLPEPHLGHIGRGHWVRWRMFGVPGEGVVREPHRNQVVGHNFVIDSRHSRHVVPASLITHVNRGSGWEQLHHHS